MRYCARIYLLFIAGLLLGPRCLPHSPEHANSQEPLQLGVRFYNNAQISDGAVRATKKVVAQVLSESGIRLTWTDCNTNPATSGGVSLPCDASARATDLVLYFVGSSDLSRWVDRDTLGYSIILTGNQLSTMAYISCPRVARLSAYTSVDVPELLGLAVAHEIGHLLLGSHSHASQGIMRATWKLADIEHRGWELTFTPDQSQRLRDAAQARLRVQTSEINH